MNKIIILTLCLLLQACSQKPFQIIAHRGASGYLPEHTLESYAMAHAFNPNYIEPDLVMTKDNQIIILHDHHLDTTTDVAEKFPGKKRKDGRYYAIDFTLKQIKQLAVTERFDPKTGKQYYSGRFTKGKSSFRVPTFVEFIELIQGLNKSRSKTIGIIPEIKAPEFHQKEGKDLTSVVLRILQEYGYEENGQAIIQCFYPETLKQLKKKTKIPLLQLIAEKSWKETSADYDYLVSEEGLREISRYATYLGPWIPQVLPMESVPVTAKVNLSLAKKYQLKVFPYTLRVDQLPLEYPNKRLFFEEIRDLDIDGVFTDFPDIKKL